MNKILKNIGLFFLLAILAWPLTYFAAWIYQNIINFPVGGSFLGFDPYLFGGFFMVLLLLSSLYISLVVQKKVIGIVLVVILFIIFSVVFSGVWSQFIFILLGSSILGWLLGEGILWSYNKLKK